MPLANVGQEINQLHKYTDSKQFLIKCQLEANIWNIMAFTTHFFQICG